MIPESTIRVAAGWLSQHHREPFDDESDADMREYRYLRAKRMLEDAEAKSKPGQMIGMCVPCGGETDGFPNLANVHIFENREGVWCIFGYLPGDTDKPSFIDPFTANLEYRARWAAEDARKAMQEQRSADSPASPQ